MTEEQKERNIMWAERFEEEARLLEKGPNDPMPEMLRQARISSAREMAEDLRAEIATAEATKDKGITEVPE